MTSAATGRRFECGTLTTPSLAELRAAVGSLDEGRSLKARQIVADVKHLHEHPASQGALFQVASQFNLLEMISPRQTPDDGVTGYAFDRTQGPACAMAAGAATVYRNYFASVGGLRGQTARRQLDMLSDIGDVLGNVEERLWVMRSGYALCTEEGLVEIGDHIAGLDEAGRAALKDRLRIGLHEGVEVTAGVGPGPLVGQVFCSAMPVAYSRHSSVLWEPFARLVLEAAYEATLACALLRKRAGGSGRVFLTLLGGGAFGNRPVWILDALAVTLLQYASSGLDVSVVSYRMADPDLDELLCELAWAEE